MAAVAGQMVAVTAMVATDPITVMVTTVLEEAVTDPVTVLEGATTGQSMVTGPALLVTDPITVTGPMAVLAVTDLEDLEATALVAASVMLN